MYEFDENKVKEFFASQLTHYLDLNSRTQYELAEHLGVSKQIVSQWCKGNKLPRMNKVQAIADYLNCKVGDLVVPTEADVIRDTMKEKYNILMSLSEKATEEDLDKIIQIANMILGD